MYVCMYVCRKCRTRTRTVCDFEEKVAVESTSCAEVEVEVAKREQSTHSLRPWRRHDPVVAVFEEEEDDEDDDEDVPGSWLT